MVDKYKSIFVRQHIHTIIVKMKVSH